MVFGGAVSSWVYLTTPNTQSRYL